MDITVIDTHATEHFLEHYNIQWELATKKIRSRVLMGILVYSGMIALGLFGVIFGEESSDSLINVPADVFFLSFGAAMLYTTLYGRYAYKKRNRENLEYIKKVSDLMRLGENTSTIKLTSDSISLEYYGVLEQISWEYINHFSVHQNLIIFHENPKALDGMVIRKELLTPEEYDEILFFCGEKLTRHYY